MKTKTIGWLIVTTLTATLSAMIGLRAVKADQLASERERIRTEVMEARRLAEENHRLAARLPKGDDLAALQSDHAAVTRLRSELTRLRDQAQKVNAVAPDPAPSGLPSRIVPASEWKYAGRVTPAATVETLLWAANGGDVQALAQTLWMDAPVRTKATALLDSLPASGRSEYATPEHLVALFTAKDIPNGAMQVVSEARQPSGDVMMRVRLFQPDGSTRSTTLLARQTEGEWRLAVPASAIDKYASVLQGAVVK